MIIAVFINLFILGLQLGQSGKLLGALTAGKTFIVLRIKYLFYRLV